MTDRTRGSSHDNDAARHGTIHLHDIIDPDTGENPLCGGVRHLKSDNDSILTRGEVDMTSASRRYGSAAAESPGRGSIVWAMSTGKRRPNVRRDGSQGLGRIRAEGVPHQGK